MALMSAFVTPNGALAGGVGATGAAPLNTGFYRVTFDRSVEDCNFVASVGRADGIINPIGVATAWWDSGEDAVLVFTSDFDGSLADHPFQVIVFCAG
jgi:hypothetical protein